MIHLMSSLAALRFGLWEMVMILGVLMLLFGAKKLPLLARGLGHGIKNFRGELKEKDDSESDERRP
jgi:sec-independent protein translocase protein TatA